MISQPQGILLDAANTVFGARCSRLERFTRFLCGEGYRVDTTRLRQVMAAADREFDWPDIPHVRTFGEEWELWTAYCCRVLGEVDIPTTPDLVARAVQDCTYLRCVDLYPDTLPALRWWQGRVRLGLISNAEPSFREALGTLGLLPYFDEVVLSCEVGLRKPDPAIYQLALRNLNLLAEETWFVDDQPENVRGAIGVGIRGYRIHRGSGRLESDGDLPTIRALTDLTGRG